MSLKFTYDIEIEGMLELKRFARKLQRLADLIGKETKAFFRKHAPEYENDAKKIIVDVVYKAYKPEVYDRTDDLRDAPKAIVQSDGESLSIVIDETAGTVPKTAPGDVSYGRYFITGGGYLERVKTATSAGSSDIRNFLAVWGNAIGGDFLERFEIEVLSPALEKVGYR